MKNLTPKPSSISDFQSYLNNLYAHKNKEREIEYLFSYLFRNISYLSRSKESTKNWNEYYIKSLSWLLATSNKLNIKLEDSLIKKFPGVCPYCIESPCACAKTGERPDQVIPEWKLKDELYEKYNIELNNSRSLNIDKHVEKINSIYPANRHIWNATGHTYHFARVLEELGEIHEAYTGFCKGERTIEQVSEELADVLAWLLSAWGIVNNTSLSDQLIDYYYKSCPVCNLEKCDCTDYSSRGQRLVKISELEEFQKKLQELLNEAPDKLSEIKTIIDSIDLVKTESNTTSAKRVVKQGISVLEKIGGALEATDGIGERISKTARAVLAFAQTFDWL